MKRRQEYELKADLVNQLFDFSEKRLVRILLLITEFGELGELSH